MSEKTVINVLEDRIPEYYPGMENDGYSLTAMLHAYHKKFIREYEERELEKQSVGSIKITSEVKVR